MAFVHKDLLSTLYGEVACSIGEMLSISIKLVFFYTMTELSQICPKTMSHFFIQYLPDTIQNSIESRTLDEKGEK